MKKCKVCKGKGFVFYKTVVATNKTIFGFPVFRDTGEKGLFSKCYGKGVQNKQLMIFRK